MKILFTLCFFVWVTQLQAGERIDPAGIDGALVLSGVGRSDTAVESFYELAEGKSAQVVILAFDSHEHSKAEGLQLGEQGDAVGAKAPTRFWVGGATDPSEAIASLKSATGVWIVAGGQGRLTKDWVGEPLTKALRALLKRGRVVGGSGAAADAFAEELGFLPGCFIDTRHRARLSASPLALALKKQPGRVGYEIARDGAMIVQGRRIRAAGDSVKIHLAASKQRAAKQIELKVSEGRADLTALRLAATARQGERFPAAEPPSPEVEKGTLIIIGGGGMPKGIVDKFVKLAGGAKASIVVLPTAHPDPVSKKEGIEGAFRRAGAGRVTVLRERTLDKVDSKEYLKAFRNATGIWFSGGRQWRFADAYLDTKALEAMHGVLKRGGVIMGSSAGASIQADYLARANPLGNLDIMAEGYERGLGFIKGVAIDQHFAQRRRFKDMSLLVDTYPQVLGLGIDESTALIVEGKIGQVVGKHQVHFFDRRKPAVNGKSDYESVGTGGRYDLVARRIIPE